MFEINVHCAEGAKNVNLIIQHCVGIHFFAPMSHVQPKQNVCNFFSNISESAAKVFHHLGELNLSLNLILSFFRWRQTRRETGNNRPRGS